MKKRSSKEVAAFLRERDNFSILTHARPDGDTLGSSAALCRMLRQLGKTAHVLENPEITETYAWLHQGLTKTEADPNDTIICVDVGASHLLPACFQRYLGRIDLRIDHHGDQGSFSRLELVDTKAGACTEIIYELSLALGLSLDGATADALYTGTITDTSCFQFANTTSHTLTVAAACVAAGARNFEINQMVFQENLLQLLQLQSHIAQNMHIFAQGKMAMVSIPWAVTQKIGATEDDLNNILNFLQALSKAQLAATLLETEQGGTRLSIRSVPGVDGSGIAAAFGGGGHKVAAGANMTMPLKEAEKAVEKEMLHQFGEIL